MPADHVGNRPLALRRHIRAAGHPPAPARAAPGGRANQRRGQPSTAPRQGERRLIMTIFQTLLETKPVLLADGGMGTGLFGLGLATGDSPELWNALHPDRIASVHQGFVEAGSDIILTNSFGGTRHRLKLHEAHDRVTELNLAAAQIARRVADAADRRGPPPGSLGPPGGRIFPPGAPPTAEARAGVPAQAGGPAPG